MKRLVVASQMSLELAQAFAQQLPDLNLLTVPQTAILPPEVEVLIAAPYRGVLPEVAPPGWPFGLKWVHLISVGIDFYPPWLFAAPVVTSAHGTSAPALAEFALAAIFAEAKRLPSIWINEIDQWAPVALDMVEGRTLGIVGFGSIGQALAPRARALGLRVLAIRHTEAPIAAPGVEQLQDIRELFQRSDHIVLAAPATPATFHLVDRELLAHAKPGLHLVNIARGSLIDDNALLEALDCGRVESASLDVTDPEPLPANHRYYTHPRVRLSPHTSVHTPHTLRNLIAQFADNLARLREGTRLKGVTNLARGY